MVFFRPCPSAKIPERREPNIIPRGKVPPRSWVSKEFRENSETSMGRMRDMEIMSRPSIRSTRAREMKALSW